jgi:anti-sigma B factor antagonist
MVASGTRRAGPGEPGNGRANGEFRLDEERPKPGTVVVSIHGDTDLHVVGELGDRLGEIVDERPSALILDLSTATFLDSMAIGVLLRTMKRVRERGGRFRIVAPRSEIRRIFEMTLLDRVFELDSSRTAALAATAAGGAGAPAG